MNRSRTRSPGPEESCPVAGRRRAIRQIRVGVARHVREIGRPHPHLAPRLPIGDRAPPSLLADVMHEVANGSLVEVVVVGLLLELREDALRRFVRPIRQHHDVLAVIAKWLGIAGLDEERPVHAALFLEGRVAVIPVRARLPDLKPIDVGLARSDAVEAEARNAVHVRGKQDAVPMNRRVVFTQRVRDTQRDRVAFLPSQNRRRQRTVDGLGHLRRAREVHELFADLQVELGAGQYRRLLARSGLRPGGVSPQTETGDDAAHRETLDERPSRWLRDV